MNCQETGFQLTTGREDDWPGIVNFCAKCLGVETEITSNDEYNRDMECRLLGQQIVGNSSLKRNAPWNHKFPSFVCLIQ